MAESLSTKPILEHYKLELTKLNFFDGGVAIGEPREKPSTPSCVIILGPEWNTYSINLADAMQSRMITVRIYIAPFTRPNEIGEFKLDEAVTTVLQMIAENAGTIEELSQYQVDVQNVRVNFGYQEWGRDAVRIADVAIPIIMDGALVW